MADATRKREDLDGREDAEVGALVVLRDPKYHSKSGASVRAQINLIANDHGRLAGFQVLHRDFRESGHRFDLAQRTGIHYGQFEVIGKATKKEGNGINKYPDKITVELFSGKSVSAYRALTSSSGMKDGTAAKIVLCPQRFLMGPQQGQNTCSQDVVFWVALQLLVGLVQRDQLYPDDFRRLSPPAQILYLNSLVPWATESDADQTVMNDARNHFCRALDKHTSHSSTSHLRWGEMHDVNEVLAVALAGIPQFSWTEAESHFCCKTHHMCERPPMSVLSAGPDASPEPGLQTTSIEERIRLHFYGAQADSEPCAEGDACNRQPLLIPGFIVDCPPLTLAVDLMQGITADQELSLRLFDDVRFPYWDKSNGLHDGEKMASYAIRGAIFRVDKFHFVARWRWTHQNVKDGVVSCMHEYDGHKTTQGGAIELGDIGFFENMHELAECVTIFYRRIDHKSSSTP